MTDNFEDELNIGEFHDKCILRFNATGVKNLVYQSQKSDHGRNSAFPFTGLLIGCAAELVIAVWLAA